MIAQNWYIGVAACARVNASGIRNMHTPCKLQRWGTIQSASSGVSAVSGTPRRSVDWRWNTGLTQSLRMHAETFHKIIVFWLIIHGFRHRGCLRAHPRCCHRLLCVEWKANPNPRIFSSSAFQHSEKFAENFRFWGQKSILKKNRNVACYEWGGEGWLGLWLLFGMYITVRR